MDIGRFVDSETGETINVEANEDNKETYQELLNSNIVSLIRTYCAGAQIGYTRISADTDIDSFMMTQLPQTGILEL